MNSKGKRSTFFPRKGRRRPRPINSCIECRQRKLKCSKSYPCENCVGCGRECVFMTGREAISTTNGDCPPNSNERPDQIQVARPEEIAATPSRDYDWEVYQQGIMPDQDLWETLEADPEATHDGLYDDSDEDEEGEDSRDFCLQLGKMIITERIGGLFRPQYAKELRDLLSSKPPSPVAPSHEDTRMSSAPLTAWHKAQSFLPSSDILFESQQSGNSEKVFSAMEQQMYLPSRIEADILLHRYLTCVDPFAHVLHRQSFENLFKGFWAKVQAGIVPSNPTTALIFSVCLAAAISLSPLQTQTQLGTSRQRLVHKLKTGTERALVRANFMRTSSIRTLQALTVYLIPQCRSEVSRSHSVLVGALIRLAQCIGIHRETSMTGMSALQRHLRGLLWYQICFLDIKTAEAQGPQPSIRADEFDIPFPMNVDDASFESLGADIFPVQGWTDMTFSLIRFECNELHRMIFRGRLLLDQKLISLHELRSHVMSKKQQIKGKYLDHLDSNIPIQRCAGLVAKLLLARCDSMLLYRHLPKAERSESEIRLRDILIEAALITLETGAILENDADLVPWAWYAGTYQQYHTVILLLSEVYKTPDLARSDRIWSMIEHVFGECYGISRLQRCGDILLKLKEALETFYDLRKVKVLAELPEMSRNLNFDLSNYERLSNIVASNAGQEAQILPDLSKSQAATTSQMNLGSDIHWSSTNIMGGSTQLDVLKEWEETTGSTQWSSANWDEWNASVDAQLMPGFGL